MQRLRDLLSRAWGVRALLLTLIALSLCGCASSVDESGADLGTEQQPLTALLQINSGGGAVSPFAADQSFSGGNTYGTGSAISTVGVTDAAPAAVYQSERFGNFSYTVGGLTPNAAYTVRLHFAEIYWNAVGQRRFNVSINGTQVLTNFDIFAIAGANKAVVRDFAANANASG
ncbi:MAG TPA: malectin domain-containing carbohydrate-binding protein, partial [Polyangiaceae bacterium]|nr:malectin domain-containing carbohydrate-binding protein [Polyangiaceae bacterium]